jgi:GNAT superfamily N-acetyltransferase
VTSPSVHHLSPIQFRPIRADEVDEACKLAREVFDRFIAPTQDENCRRLFHRYAQPDQLLHRHNTRYTTWVAAAGSQVIGILHIHACNHISMLYIAPELQGHRCGSELLQTASAAGALRAPITVNSSPTADRFYARLGFAPTGPERTVNGVRFQPMRLAQ